METIIVPWNYVCTMHEPTWSWDKDITCSGAKVFLTETDHWYITLSPVEIIWLLYNWNRLVNCSPKMKLIWWVTWKFPIKIQGSSDHIYIWDLKFDLKYLWYHRVHLYRLIWHSISCQYNKMVPST